MNRVHVVTLGVSDMRRALRFYRDGLGFEASVEEENPSIVFSQSGGTTLAFCPREGMAKDINQDHPPHGEGFAGITLAYVAREQDEVDRIMELAERAGGEVVKKPQRVFWRGYSGYFHRLINEHDLSVCDELLADDYVNHDTPADVPLGPGETKWFVTQMLKDRPDIQITVEDVLAEGDRVALRNIWHWTDGESGEKQHQMGILILRLNDAGQIAERWSAYEMIQS
jgi:catechol 2,3-dioxygenase-like lactoylglutathione lyase family enzyme